MVGLQPAVISAGPYDSSVARREWTVSPPRVLSTFELSMFTQDGGTAYLNGHECPIKKGWILLGKPGDLRWNKLHFRCQTIHFSAEERTLLQLLDTLPQFFRPEAQAETMKLFVAVHEAYASEARFAAVAASGRLCQLLCQLHAHNAVEGVSGDRGSVRRAVQLIRQRYDEPLSVEQMAKACGLSVSRFHKMFIEATGTTPNRYLILTRLTAAKTMLLAGNQSVAQVSESCGFTSQAYFCECMKRYTGMTPRQFRRVPNHPEEP